MDIITAVFAIGIPSTFTGFCFWCLEKKMERRQTEQDKKDGLMRLLQLTLLGWEIVIIMLKSFFIISLL